MILKEEHNMFLSLNDRCYKSNKSKRHDVNIIILTLHSYSGFFFHFFFYCCTHLSHYGQHHLSASIVKFKEVTH